MLTRDKLVNIALFMERADCKGKEALAWAQTYEAVHQEIARIDNPQTEKKPDDQSSAA